LCCSGLESGRKIHRGVDQMTPLEFIAATVPAAQVLAPRTKIPAVLQARLVRAGI
jgi:hypothetical protein